jgi:hypothetical protein
MGNRLTRYEVDKIKILDPLPCEEQKEEPPVIDDEQKTEEGKRDDNDELDQMQLKLE